VLISHQFSLAKNAQLPAVVLVMSERARCVDTESFHVMSGAVAQPYSYSTGKGSATTDVPLLLACCCCCCSTVSRYSTWLCLPSSNNS